MKRTEQDMVTDIHLFNEYGRKKEADSMWQVLVAHYYNESLEETACAIQEAQIKSPGFPFDFDGFDLNSKTLKL